MNKKTPKTLDLEFKRTIAAEPKAVFDGWINGTVPGTPWHKAAQSIRNPVKNGLYYFRMQGDNGRHSTYGRFLKVERPKLVQMTWVAEFTYGLESIVTLRLKPAGAKTELTLRHEKLPADEMGRRHKDGWMYYLDALAKMGPKMGPQKQLR